MCTGPGHHCSRFAGFLWSSRDTVFSGVSTTDKLRPEQEWGALSTLAPLHLSPWLFPMAKTDVSFEDNSFKANPALGGWIRGGNWRPIMGAVLGTPTFSSDH